MKDFQQPNDSFSFLSFAAFIASFVACKLQSRGKLLHHCRVSTDVFLYVRCFEAWEKTLPMAIHERLLSLAPQSLILETSTATAVRHVHWYFVSAMSYWSSSLLFLIKLPGTFRQPLPNSQGQYSGSGCRQNRVSPSLSNPTRFFFKLINQL